MMTNNLPLVSILIPAYNAARTIIEAVDSALNQTHPAIEVIIIDDGSSDDTPKLIRQRYETDSRVKFITQTNGGPASARNHALRLARGEWVQFLDSDDRLHPQKITQSLARAAQIDGAAVVYGPAHIIDQAGNPAPDWDFPAFPSGDVFCAWITGAMANGSYGVLPSFMAKRAAVESVGGFDEAIFGSEDWDLWIKLAARYPFAALSEKWVDYRDHDGGIHRNRVKMATARLKVIQNARQNPRAGDCLSPHGWDKLEAGRWHVLALAQWSVGNRAAARESFATAQKLAPSRVRDLYRAMTYALPESIAAWVDSAIRRLASK